MVQILIGLAEVLALVPVRAVPEEMAAAVPAVLDTIFPVLPVQQILVVVEGVVVVLIQVRLVVLAL
tara:strand:+ start:479 stop:676 length:198 start_codon:yes stop_codon:yes gene_type:complete